MTPTSSFIDIRIFSAGSVVIFPIMIVYSLFVAESFRLTNNGCSLGPPFQVKKKIEEAFTKAEKKEIYDKALEALKSGQFPNPNSCATHFGVCVKTLRYLIEENKEFVRGGRKTVIFTAE